MKITPVTRAIDVRNRLLQLIKDCHSFQWATAWASESEVLDAAINSNKMTSFIIGTHQYFTAPEVLDKCLDIPEVRVMHPKGPMFHPKLYVFFIGERIEVFVGSSNLTKGGLEKNIECGIFINGESTSPSLQNLAAHVSALWQKANELDDDFITTYKANHRRVRSAQQELEDFVKIEKPKKSSLSADDITPHKMNWSEFLDLVKRDKMHGLDKRLSVLSQARQLFAKAISFADLEEEEQMCIAGILQPSERNDVNWAYFGQMSSYGSYTPILKRHAKLFSKALDKIPLQGKVTHEHYKAYLSAFLKIPGASKTWTGMGTRLLAMKRPDYFVCIDGANRYGLCTHFSVAPTTTNLSNYWERIIKPMMMTPWWDCDMPPKKSDQQTWMGRAAMLDAIYYDPKERKK